MAPYFQNALDHLVTFEGEIPWMYQDTVGKVTVGVGLMLPSAAAAQTLPFEHPGGMIATPLEIAADYDRVAAQGRGMVAARYKTPTALILPDDVIHEKLLEVLMAFEQRLRVIFPEYDSYPDTVKTGLLHMIYGEGERGLVTKFPHFCAAIARQDWNGAGVLSHRYQLAVNRNTWTSQCFYDAVPKPTLPLTETA